MNVNTPEKIGTSEWVTIRKHARTLYLPLKQDLVQAFNLGLGDLLQIKIEKVIRKQTKEEN